MCIRDRTCGDYSHQNQRSGSIINSDLDNIIRTISPRLTIKIIDACHSGVRYIKSDAPNKFVSGIQDCIMMLSSMQYQQSIALERISLFTKTIAEAINKHEGNLHYSAISSYISDVFNNSDFKTRYKIDQKPVSYTHLTLPTSDLV